MSEFFIELFSEEIPTDLQSLARENIVTGFKNFFNNFFFNKNLIRKF